MQRRSNRKSLAALGRVIMSVTAIGLITSGMTPTVRLADEPVTLDWKTMAALNYRTGEMPESLKKLNGVTVRVPGFMVPLEDTETRVTEFLLVPYFGACIHVPPPPPNQMAHVLMRRNQTVEVNLWDPIWIVGKLTIENVESPYGVVGFQVTGERILPYEG